MGKAFEIVLRPLLTEKAGLLQETKNQVVFEVHPEANRQEIRREVERIFPKVKVTGVATVNVRGKVKRVGRSQGKRSNWKKAIVTLREGDHIDLLEGNT